jgi:hypothetical protein
VTHTLTERDERAALRRDNHQRALRHSLWIGLLHAQELGFHDVEHQIVSVLVHVDAITDRVASEVPA